MSAGHATGSMARITWPENSKPLNVSVSESYQALAATSPTDRPDGVTSVSCWRGRISLGPAVGVGCAARSASSR